MFVFSFDIFDQRQGFGFRAVFVMLCDGPRRGRAGETGAAGGQVKPRRGAQEQVKPRKGAQEGR